MLNSTRADELRNLIEEEIVAGKLRPGERLDEQIIAQRFKVSRTPVREAIRQLVTSGLVHKPPRQRAVVALISVRRLMDMFEVVAELEGLAARLAARRMSEEERENLMKVHRGCRRLIKKNDFEEYFEANMRFHETIYAGARNEFLGETIKQIRNRLSPYRRYQLHQPGRLANSFAEHEEIVDRIIAGDGDTADRLIRQHVNIQGELLTDLISFMPDTAP